MIKFALLFLNLLLISSVFAGQIHEIPTFTDQDIEKYKKEYETDLSPQHIDRDKNEPIEENISEETNTPGEDYGNPAQETPEFHSPKGTLPNVPLEKMQNIWKSAENALVLHESYGETYIKQICEMFGISFSRSGRHIKLSNGMEFGFMGHPLKDMKTLELDKTVDFFERIK